MDMADDRDIGPIVLNVLRNPKGWGNGESISIVGDRLSHDDMFKALTNQVGVPVTLESIPGETYKTLFPGAEAIVEVYAWLDEYGYPDIASGHRAKGSACKTFVDWLKETQFKVSDFQS